MEGSRFLKNLQPTLNVLKFSYTYLTHTIPQLFSKITAYYVYDDRKVDRFVLHNAGWYFSSSRMSKTSKDLNMKRPIIWPLQNLIKVPKEKSPDFSVRQQPQIRPLMLSWPRQIRYVLTWSEREARATVHLIRIARL